MKLYSTTTSERASKGQGGNKHLHVMVQDEQKTLISIHMQPDPKGGAFINSVSGDISFLRSLCERIGQYEDITIKGERQKGDKKIRCNNCMSMLCEYELARMDDKKGERMDACPKCKTDEYLMEL